MSLESKENKNTVTDQGMMIKPEHVCAITHSFTFNARFEQTPKYSGSVTIH